MAPYDLACKTVVITGSTGGLGSALAKALRARGANIGLLDLDEAGLAAQQASLGGERVAVTAVADVRSLEQLEAGMARVAARFGRIDVVIANAGVATLQSLATGDPDVFDDTVDINLNGVWRTFRAGLPHVQQHEGYLLAIASMASFVHNPLQAHYTSSKAGVWALCDSIRLELRHLGVDVGSAHPTFFPTPMLDQAKADEAGQILWSGHTSGLWKAIPLEQVVADVVRGIEHRSDTIISPRRNTLVTRAPGLFRPLVERLGFDDRKVAAAMAAAARAARAVLVPAQPVDTPAQPIEPARPVPTAV